MTDKAEPKTPAAELEPKERYEADTLSEKLGYVQEIQGDIPAAQIMAETSPVKMEADGQQWRFTDGDVLKMGQRNIVLEKDQSME